MTVEPVLLYDTVVTLHLVHVVIVVYCLYALAHSHHLNVLFCTGVTSWVIINKFYFNKNDPTKTSKCWSSVPVTMYLVSIVDVGGPCSW